MSRLNKNQQARTNVGPDGEYIPTRSDLFCVLNNLDTAVNDYRNKDLGQLGEARKTAEEFKHKLLKSSSEYQKLKTKVESLEKANERHCQTIRNEIAKMNRRLYSKGVTPQIVAEIEKLMARVEAGIE